MVMAIFWKRGPFRYNGGEVKVVLGRAECEDYVELLRVRVALQFHVFCVCMFTHPPLFHHCSPQICSDGDDLFFGSGALSGAMGRKLRQFWEGGSARIV